MSISDKLLTVAENQKKVYDAGVFDAGYNKGYEEALENPPSPLIMDGRKRLFHFFEDLGPWEFYSYEYNEEAGQEIPVENELTPIDIPFPKGTQNISSFEYFAGTTAYIFEYQEDTGIPVRIFTGTLDVSGARSLSWMFQYCKYLEESGNIINTSKVESFVSMFAYCPKLKTVCELDLSSATNVASMFNGCVELENVSLVNMPSLSSFANMFQNCKKLTNFPTFDFSKTSNFNHMFNGCESMETAPASIGISNATNMSLNYMFNNCKNLKTIPCITVNATTNFSSTFYNCTALENITFEGTLGKTGLSFAQSPLLTHDSLMSIINALETKTSGTFKLILGSENLAKLTDEEKLIITNKGWQVS